MKTFQIDFYTQYNQFYICDKDSPLLTDSDNFWTDDAFAERLAIEDGVLGVGTECYGPVKAEMILLGSENSARDMSEFDHIVEGSLVIKSGILQIKDCPNSSIELEVKVESGCYRVRIYSSNLDSVDGDEGNDHYTIEIWKAEKAGRKVIKRYER